MSTTLPHLIVHDAPLSVAGVTLYIQDLLEQDNRLQQIWVAGEVSSANQYRSGLFFTLQDPDADAAINCVLWNSQLAQIATMPIVGEKVIVLGRLRLHRKRGTYQLNIWQVLPGGEGLRSLRNRQLRQRLEAEGLFDSARKRSLPSHPQTLAVVTSPQAAAWGDIQRTLKRRYPGLTVLFSPALVQGNQAPKSIIKAIQRVERDGRAQILIISRGGGATEDMECFNDERVVRAISECSIPVISGIGHQRDESLADLVADLHVHTPTAAAERAVPLLSDLIHNHQERRLALAQALHCHVRETQDYLHHLQDRLRRSRVDEKVSHSIQDLQWKKQRLTHALYQHLDQAEHHCQLLHQQLSDLDPTTILQRGYALARQPDGNIVRSVQTVYPNDQLHIQLADGEMSVTVDRVMNNADIGES
ncbi:MAG: exodeoxyribonuclease VII large subunit [Cyanobacteria bacterium P01_F01_bin.150]